MPDTDPRKDKFLTALAKYRITNDALSKAKISRSLYNSWLSKDSDFRDRVEEIKADILDAAKKIAYQKVGLIPDRSHRGKRWINDSLLMKILSQDPDFKDKTPYGAPPSELRIIGLDLAKIAALCAPEATAPAAPEATLRLVGEEAPKPVPEIIQKLREAKDVKSEAGRES